MSEIPVIELFGHLLVPLQGDVGDQQAESLRERVLHHLKVRGCESLILDASGVSVLDSHLCSVLAGLASAARLMGAESMLCGMTAEMVMTLQAMGIELTGVNTAINLEDALHKLGYALRRLDAPGEGAEKRKQASPRRASVSEDIPELSSIAEIARKSDAARL